MFQIGMRLIADYGLEPLDQSSGHGPRQIRLGCCNGMALSLERRTRSAVIKRRRNARGVHDVARPTGSFHCAGAAPIPQPRGGYRGNLQLSDAATTLCHCDSQRPIRPRETRQVGFEAPGSGAEDIGRKTPRHVAHDLPAVASSLGNQDGAEIAVFRAKMIRVLPSLSTLSTISPAGMKSWHERSLRRDRAL
jgi:hypothetical protein